ncbi:MAG: hypothetical protein MJ224_00070 [archaeon]|nr:hypothetical protein [archaeon]
MPSGEFDGEHTQKRNGAIKLEKVHGVINDNGELKSYTDYISGETVCIIPFPKGTQERDYLF